MPREPWLADIAEHLDPLHTATEQKRWWQECGRKERYYRIAYAEAVISRMLGQRPLTPGEPNMTIYDCHWAPALGDEAHFHIGHESKRYARKESRR